MKTYARWLLVILISILAVPAASNTFMPFYIVDGDSMLPSFHSGNIVFIHNHLPQDIKDIVGKVVVFPDYSLGTVTIHRVIAVNGPYLKTQGDNALAPDTFKPAVQDILGIVYAQL